MPLTERDIRKVINTKQSTVEFDGIPSPSSMIEGQVALHKKSNTLLALYRKKFGKLWKTYLSTNGDQIIDRNLDVVGRAKSRVTAKDLIFEQGSELQISSGAISVNKSFHKVAVESGTSDALDNINGGVTGQILILKAADDSRTVVVRDNSTSSGNIYVSGGSDFPLDTDDDIIVLFKDLDKWYGILAVSL
jgi:hypothetical protein